MGAPKLQRLPTVDEYLAGERAAFERHTYIDGQILVMAGESDSHGIISVNLVMIVAVQLRGTSCQARTKDTKVRSGPIPETGRGTRGMYSYPDVLVICGEPEYHDSHKDIVLNPKAIFEVLSENTEAFDRGEKFLRLQAHNPTLTDYVLIGQDAARIEHFQKQADGRWLYSLHAGLETSVVVESIACTLKLAEVYDRVEFPSDESDPAGSE